MRLSICGAAFLVASIVPAAAWADGAGPNFGKSGQLAISWDQALGTPYVATATAGGGGAILQSPGSLSMLDFQYATINNNVGSGTHFGLAPAADYFVMDSLSVGGQVAFSISSASPSQGQGVSVTTWGLAPQVGYDLHLTDNISVWPKLFFGYASTSVSNNGPTYSVGDIGVFVPFLYHPVQHFFVGLGPNFSTQVISSVSQNGKSSDGNKATAFGIMATFGGYFLGD